MHGQTVGVETCVVTLPELTSVIWKVRSNVRNVVVLYTLVMAIGGLTHVPYIPLVVVIIVVCNEVLPVTLCLTLKQKVNVAHRAPFNFGVNYA